MSDLKEVYYGFTEESLSPFKAFSESVGLVKETEIVKLIPPFEVGDEKYHYRLTIDVKLSDLGSDKAMSIYDGLEEVSKGTTFKHLRGMEITSYFQMRIKEERLDVSWFAEEERMLA